MRGEFNGLQKLIQDENPYAFYIHCFAHQLQLVVVTVSKCCSSLEDFLDYVTSIVSSTSASCKRKDLLLHKHCLNLLSKLEREKFHQGEANNKQHHCQDPEIQDGDLITRLCVTSTLKQG
jgi:hypothetical protein